MPPVNVVYIIEAEKSYLFNDLLPTALVENVSLEWENKENPLIRKFISLQVFGYFYTRNK